MAKPSVVFPLAIFNLTLGRSFQRPAPSAQRPSQLRQGGKLERLAPAVQWPGFPHDHRVVALAGARVILVALEMAASGGF